MGSPPRVRGKDTIITELANVLRITPACAGKSGFRKLTSAEAGDHPRVCGEKSAASIWAICARGSPPRMRGKDPRFIDDDTAGGITPACAGKRPVSPIWWTPCQDHPRVCGEKFDTPSIPQAEGGSPPRVRGKVFPLAGRVCLTGITPACAGKSKILSSFPKQSWDHPRVCGEKWAAKYKNECNLGSPPRVRGKDKSKLSQDLFDGITPACAGKRLKRSHSIGHFSYILCLFHSVLHRASASGGSRAGPCAPPCLPAQNAVPV